jgi:hypothetical protein
MTSHCEQVAERLALGESLDPLAEHLAGCAACRRLAEVPGRIGAARRAVDPGLGFSARMTAGAQHRIAVRRRRRMAAGLAATVAAGALGVVFVTREPAAPQPAVAVPEPRPEIREDPQPVPAAEDELAALVNLADTERSLRLSANWKGIEEPLAGYRKLVREVEANEEGEAP